MSEPQARAACSQKQDPCLDPEPAAGDPAGNAVADAVRLRALNGAISPSVRDPDEPSVAPGAAWRFVWSGAPEPAIERAPQ